MNEQLKFSIGHIIAFVALCVIGFATFSIGLYENGGTINISLENPQATLTTIRCCWPLFATLSVLFIVFMGAQWAKAAKRKFNKVIWIERGLIIGSPFIFIACMQPFYFFCNVHSKSSSIIGHYMSIVATPKQMFTDYEGYADERIANYEHTLSHIIAYQKSIKKKNSVVFNFKGSNREIEYQKKEFEGFNFKGSNREIEIQKDNMIKTLRLQLLSENYNDMKAKVLKWADEQQKPSTWNLALIGKLASIKAGIHGYSERLNAFSSHVLSNEGFDGNNIQTFAESSTILAFVNNEFEEVKKLSSSMPFPPVWSLFVSFVLYIMLLLPYLIQERNTKNPFRLIDTRTRNGVLIIDDTSETDKNIQSTTKTFTIVEEASSPSKKGGNDKQGDYKPFSL